MDPRLSEINELWDKRLTISMHIEDKDIRDKNNDGMDCWEFTYQQIESTTMSQYEFDRIRIRIRIKQPPKSLMGKGSTLEPYTLPFCKGIDLHSF